MHRGSQRKAEKKGRRTRVFGSRVEPGTAFLLSWPPRSPREIGFQAGPDTLRASKRHSEEPMELISSLDARIAGQRMLDHPFYQRWTAGELTRGELQEYARQYYHYAMAFPTFLSSMHARSDDLEARQHLLENLIEEERGPEHHPALWFRFCEALGLDRDIVKAATPNAATSALIDCMRNLSRSS